MITPILYLLVAIGCGVAAAPNSSNDHPKVVNLAQDEVKEVSDFCALAPELVRQHLFWRGPQDFATHIFDILYHLGDQIGLEPYTFQRATAEQLASKIRDSDKNIADFELSPLVELPSEEKFAYIALFGLLEQTKNAASRETLSMLDKYREVFGASNMRERLEQACVIVHDLETSLRNRYDSYPLSTSSKSSLESVRCTTSQKVLHLKGICRFILQAPKVQGELTYVPVI